MSKLFLKAILALLGIAAISIGLSMMLMGANATGQFFTGLINVAFSQTTKLDGFSSPNVDSELRFYAVFWIAYGVVLVDTVRDFSRKMGRVPVLAGLFFAGGLGRTLSWFSVGEPHLLFKSLLAIELGLPVMMIVLWFAILRKPI